ncbi:AAEL000144-PA [Aedes aegypti]|uniref:AAEL000144-PA n=1 Tax=Aedes aegypti TaxID=7159 RepID=Q17Q63_AEDAE|nr:AAEL000144-PA [Aedes aegypti]
MCRIKHLLATVLILVGVVHGGQTNSGCKHCRPNHNCPQQDRTLEVVFRHEEYVDRYYRCLSGVAYEFQCPFGIAFDPIQGRCRYASEGEIRSWQARQLMPCEKCVGGVKFVELGAFLPQYLQCVSEGIAELKTCPVGQSRTRSVQLLWMSDHCEGFLTTRSQRIEDYPSAHHHSKGMMKVRSAQVENIITRLEILMCTEFVHVRSAVILLP